MVKSKKTDVVSKTPGQRLEESVLAMLNLAKTAKRNNVNLSGDNYYGNKTAELRADATVAFAELRSSSAGDTTAMAELIETVFGAKTKRKERLAAARELQFSLRTTWRNRNLSTTSTEDDGPFPMSILAQTRRGYLTTLGRQMNGCYSGGWYDACAVMMRRLLEIAIIEVYESKSSQAEIKDQNDNYLQLTDLIGRLVSGKSIHLTRNSKTALPRLKDVGHQSAHGRYFTATKSDIDQVKNDCRVCLEELLHHSGLLK